MAPNSGDYDFFGGSGGRAATPAPGAPPTPSAPTSAPFAGGTFGTAPGVSGGFAQPIGTGSQNGRPATARPASRTRGRKGQPKRFVTLGIVAAVVVAGFVLAPKLHAADRIAYYRTSISMPDEAGGVTRNTSAAAQKLEADPTPILGGVLATKTPQLAVYDAPDGRAGVLVAAAKLKHPFFGDTEAKSKEIASTLMTKGGGVFTEFKTVPSGKLGGTIQCTSTTLSGATLRLCTVIDAAALMAITLTDTTADDATVLAIRESVEHR